MDQGEFIFMLSISPNQYVRYYQGDARYIVARTRDGRTVRFPAHVLRPFVTHEGVHGEFRLRYDKSNRLVSFERLSAGGRDDA